MERSVLEGADRVITASRLHAESLKARLPEGEAHRVLHLPNGFEPVAPPSAAASASLSSDTFLVVFTGTMSQLTDIETLLEAVHDLLARHPEGRRRVRVELLGAHESGYEDRSVALGLKGIVRFLGPRTHTETRALQRRADVLMLLKPHGPGFRAMVPGKLYEYLEARRPIVALIEEGDEAAELLRRAEQPILPPGRREPLTDELERRYLAWRAEGRAADTDFPGLSAYERRQLAERLAGTLDDLARPSAR
jgi:glycosyltransferase involved in cell wall biosynthesis